jgi:hypothetical protein
MITTQTLIIHPQDRSTIFLNDVYTNIPNKTVIQGGVSKTDVTKLIKSHDRVMMMGHGSPHGLFSIGQFYNTFGFIVDKEMASLLDEKTNNVFIWCYASQFLQTTQLRGFATGMFISEVSEANYCGVKLGHSKMVDESNASFVKVISACIHLDSSAVYSHLLVSEYALLAQKNPVAKYNYDRLYYN